MMHVVIVFLTPCHVKVFVLELQPKLVYGRLGGELVFGSGGFRFIVRARVRHLAFLLISERYSTRSLKVC